MIVGTAGHINHGKTTLVHALTGIMTDKLEEEKKRGISIELGYAHINLQDGKIIHFIDVPGHERFIKTMVAGISGIDFALLLVAADDGIMPQTREHLRILDLLGISHGAIVITKIDKVDSIRLFSLHGEIRNFISKTFLKNSLIFNLDSSSRNDPGLFCLKQYLIENVQKIEIKTKNSNINKFFRMPIDRVFTVPGHGTVVTGSIIDGQIRMQDIKNMNLHLMPNNQKIRIRNIHSTHKNTEIAYAGQRCALNLADIEKERIKKGNWISDARCFIPSMNIAVNFHLLESSCCSLKNWSAIQIHLATSRYFAHLVLLEKNSVLNPGNISKVQLVFDSPVCCMIGDRFIAREVQRNLTIGGGEVLDPNASNQKRHSFKKKKWLDAMQSFLNEGCLDYLLFESPFGINEQFLERIMNGKSVDSLPRSVLQLQLNEQSSKIFILPIYWNFLKRSVIYNLSEFHKKNPEEPGLNFFQLRNIVSPKIPISLWRILLNELSIKKQIIFNYSWICTPEHDVVELNTEETILSKKCMLLILKDSNPSWIRDLAKKVCIDEPYIRRLFKKLVRKGELIQIVPDLFYHKKQIADLRKIFSILYLEKRKGVTPSSFRDTTKISRKRSIQILEYFNKIGYTIREKNNGNHILNNSNSI